MKLNKNDFIIQLLNMKIGNIKWKIFLFYFYFFLSFLSFSKYLIKKKFFFFF